MSMQVVLHYTHVTPQPIEVINASKLSFNIGNCIKYLVRAEFKGSELQDLEKVLEYLFFEEKHYGVHKRYDIKALELVVDTNWTALKYYDLIIMILKGCHYGDVRALILKRMKDVR